MLSSFARSTLKGLEAVDEVENWSFKQLELWGKSSATCLERVLSKRFFWILNILDNILDYSWELGDSIWKLELIYKNEIGKFSSKSVRMMP